MKKTFCDICDKEIKGNKITSKISIETTIPEVHEYHDVCHICTASIFNWIENLKMEEEED